MKKTIKELVNDFKELNYDKHNHNLKEYTQKTIDEEIHMTMVLLADYTLDEVKASGVLNDKDLVKSLKQYTTLLNDWQIINIEDLDLSDGIKERYFIGDGTRVLTKYKDYYLEMSLYKGNSLYIVEHEYNNRRSHMTGYEDTVIDILTEYIKKN